MTHHHKIPVYSICELIGSSQRDIDMAVFDLAPYLAAHTDIKFPHKHDFYQIMLITEGYGRHVIDFVEYPLKPGALYFLSPSMMHTWHFDGPVSGYIVNFAASFFHSAYYNPFFLSEFAFFHALNDVPMLALDPTQTAAAACVLAALLEEYDQDKNHRTDVMRAHLTLFLAQMSRLYVPVAAVQGSRLQAALLRTFEQKVEEFYLTKRYPKDYAALLQITPNYLNEVCVASVGKSAGHIIRDRILLEAKRLLVHSTATIAEIAYQLNFEDNAYFSRFFKKYTGETPEQFRKK